MTKIEDKPAIKIAGMGKSVPEKIWTNADYEKMVDTSDEWITTRTGIKQRHIAEPGTPNSKFAIEAAKEALENANVSPEELDMIIIGTVTGDYKFPATAVFVQDALGAINAAAFDISAACSGFIYGLHLSDSMIRSGKAEKILVIGSEILTSMVDFKDRSTCVLFGDGAGAAVVVPAEDESGVLSTYIKSDGRLNHLLYCEGGGSAYPGTNRDLPSEAFTLKMSGNEVFKHAVKNMGEAAQIALDLANVSSDDIDLLFTHQANIRIINATAKRFKMPQEKVFINIQDYGNTSAASIPIALVEAREKGQIKPGTTVLCSAFGAGLTWASCVIRF